TTPCSSRVRTRAGRASSSPTGTTPLRARPRRSALPSRSPPGRPCSRSLPARRRTEDPAELLLGVPEGIELLGRGVPVADPLHLFVDPLHRGVERPRGVRRELERVREVLGD